MLGRSREAICSVADVCGEVSAPPIAWVDASPRQPDGETEEQAYEGRMGTHPSAIVSIATAGSDRDRRVHRSLCLTRCTTTQTIPIATAMTTAQCR